MVGYLVLRYLFGWEQVSIPMALLAAVGVGYGIWRGLTRAVVLRVDDEGVRFGDVAVPWASVWHLVLVRPEPVVGAFRTDLPPQVAVRLKRGAPLPAALDSLVTDPSDPLAIDDKLRSSVDAVEVDGAALLAAARACAPPDVVLVERQGPHERVLER